MGWIGGLRLILFSPRSFSYPVIGSSTTQLFTNLSLALPKFPPGSEIIISRIDHEANISPWVRLATLIQPHLTIKWWTPSSENPSSDSASNANGNDDLDEAPFLTADNLKPLLTEKTVMVSCTHISNILGSIHDIQSIGKLLKDTWASQYQSVPKPFFAVDGVAFAPHRRLDMHTKFPDVDFYSFSWYKVFGPHISVIYASHRVQEEGRLGSVCHYFHVEGKQSKDLDLSTRLGLAGASYELVASLPKVSEYFCAITSASGQDVWELVARHEESLASILLTFLRDNATKYSIKIIGIPQADRSLRVPVISFTVKGKSSKAIVDGVEKKTGGRLGCRWGHFYSKRLVDDILGLEEQGGVVRVSMVHYNTTEEMEDLVCLLEEILKEV